MDRICKLAAMQEGLYQGGYDANTHVPIAFVAVYPEETGEQIHRRWDMTVGMGTHEFYDICEPGERGIMSVDFLLEHYKTNGDKIVQAWKRAQEANSRAKPVRSDYSDHEAGEDFCTKSSHVIRSRKSPFGK